MDEPPAAPFPPVVVSGKDSDVASDPQESTTSLYVVWHLPENTGPAVGGYEVEWKKTTGTDFYDGDNPNTDATEAIVHTDPNTYAAITGLEPDTSYQVRVRATNGEGDTTENWSLRGDGLDQQGGQQPAPVERLNTRHTGREREHAPRGERRHSGYGVRPGYDDEVLSTGRARRGHVQLRHPDRADTDQGGPEPREPAMRLCRPESGYSRLLQPHAPTE